MKQKPTVKAKTKVIDDDLNKSDAEKLVKWWNANTDYYYFKRKMDNGKRWEIYRQAQVRKYFMSQIQFKKVKHDTNGNPRFVCHFLNFINENDKHCTEGWGIKQTSVLYGIAVKKANKIGGRKYHNKQYGGGIVFQMYEGQQVEMSRKIKEIANQ